MIEPKPVSIDLPSFDRHFCDGQFRFTRIGTGALGGKASGPGAHQGPAGRGRRCCALSRAWHVERPHPDRHRDRLLRRLPRAQPPARVARSTSMADDRIGHAFQHADLPAELLGDLRALAEEVQTPARRPLVEPARGRAGSALRRRLRHQDDPEQPARRGHALPAAGRGHQVRLRLDVLPRGPRLHPDHRPIGPSERRWRSSCRRWSAGATATASIPTSPGVARSYNFYSSGPGPARGRRREPRARPRQDDRRRRPGWTYSPAYPHEAAAVRLGDATCFEDTQTEFWAVNMGKPPAYDPISEAEYLVERGPRRRRGGRHAALRRLDLRSGPDRLDSGHRPARGAALELRSAAAIRAVPSERLAQGTAAEMPRRSLHATVEIEFAVTMSSRGASRRGPPRLPAGAADGGLGRSGGRDGGRPDRADAIVASEMVMGNGVQRHPGHRLRAAGKFFRDANPRHRQRVRAAQPPAVRRAPARTC